MKASVDEIIYGGHSKLENQKVFLFTTQTIICEAQAREVFIPKE